MVACPAAMAAFTQAFLEAFSNLGLDPWAGIEMDVAWGHTTVRFGLHRPSVTGPIFVYRVCTSLRLDTPSRTQVLSHAGLSPDQLLGTIAGQFPDLRDTWTQGGWQLCAIDATRGHSRDRSLMHPCYILIHVDDYWAFNHRPHAQGLSCLSLQMWLMGLLWTSGWSTVSMASLCRSLWVSIASFWRISCWLRL